MLAPRRPDIYRIGPLPRTGASPRLDPDRRPQSFFRSAWSASPGFRDGLISAAVFAGLLVLLTASRLRRAVLPNRYTVGLAVALAGVLALSRLRRWRARQAPLAAASRRLVDGAAACLAAVDTLILTGVNVARPKRDGARAAPRRPDGARPAARDGHARTVWEGDRGGLRRAVALKPSGRSKRGGFVQLTLAQIPSLAVLAVVCGLAISFGWLQIPREQHERSSAERAVPLVPAAISAAVAATPPTASKAALEPVTPRRSDGPGEPYEISWPYDIADGLTFGPEGAVKTRLAGLEGPPRDAVCNDRDQRPWACGLQARAALNNITRRQALLCNPLGAPQGGLIPARCAGEIDVARELVLAGFARASVPDPRLEQAEDEARQAQRGLWNGGWTVRIAAR